MKNFIHRQNVAHYQKLLESTTDEAERQRILKLLEDERGKIADDPSERKR